MAPIATSSAPRKTNDQPAAAASAGAAPSRAPKRAGKPGKAGGNGKKGKVFLEDKSDLLSLISTVTSSKAALAKGKIDKRKAVIGQSDIASGAGDAEGSGASAGANASDIREKRIVGNADRKKAERAKALNQAKASLLAKEREKKLRKTASATAPSTSDAADGKPAKKRVGFA